jgi:hypothetical protein
MSPRRELTAFEKTIPDYRRRILISLGKALLAPPLVTYLTLRFACRSLSSWLSLPLALFSIPILICVRSHYTLWAQDREAASLGAQPITRVRGRWPGNLDIVLRLLKSFESSYVLQGFADLFEEYGCTTLNTRFFWGDQVSMPLSSFSRGQDRLLTSFYQIISMDEKVFRFVAHTGFTHFEKGILWHERMYVF